MRILKTLMLSGGMVLAACSAGTGDSGGYDRDAAPPSLEMRVLSDETGELDGKTVRNMVVAFGYWAAECAAVRKPSEPLMGWCDIYPYSGELPERSTVILPYDDRATVQYFERKPAKIVLHTATRESGTELAYACGPAKWSGSESFHQLKFFYDADARPFLNQMGREDCTLTFTPMGDAEATSITLPAHGFDEANAFASKFSKSPKLEP
jgi:hypothetical protein